MTTARNLSVARAARLSAPASSAQEAVVERLIERYRLAIVGELRAALDRDEGLLYHLMRYHLGWEDQYGRAVEARGGKLLRPSLCLLCCEAVGGDWQRALPAAAALELLHNFTLIHDDVEDASLKRHGRATVWSLWGEAQAINVGDGMFALAHATLLGLHQRGHPPQRVLRAVRMLDEATLRLCEGQHRDLLSAEEPEVSGEEYLAMIEGKTATLLAASSGLGALLGGASAATVGALGEFGRRLGLAFQIRDDVLGIWGDPTLTGKPTSDDLRAGKKSYPVIVALERARGHERDELRALLARVDLDSNDLARARRLLERVGAKEESERTAREHAEAAITSLDGEALRPARRRELVRLARFAATRHA